MIIKKVLIVTAALLLVDCSKCNDSLERNPRVDGVLLPYESQRCFYSRKDNELWADLIFSITRRYTREYMRLMDLPKDSAVQTLLVQFRCHLVEGQSCDGTRLSISEDQKLSFGSLGPMRGMEVKSVNGNVVSAEWGGYIFVVYGDEGRATVTISAPGQITGNGETKCHAVLTKGARGQ